MFPLFFSPISRSARYSFLLIIALGTIIRLVGITAPLHGDELVTVSIWANMPLLAIPTHYEYPNNHIFHTLVVAIIFITKGKQPVEIIRTPEIEQGEFGRLRGIQSYRLVISKHTLRTNGDKL